MLSRFWIRIFRFIFMAWALIAMSSQASNIVVEPLARPAVDVVHPEQGFLIDIESVAGALVAVGERGLILKSSDGINWNQLSSPVSTGLTALSFMDEKNGVAVGHGGTVLGTTDAGLTWRLILDGRQAAQIVMDYAAQTGINGYKNFAKMLVADGPDKPFFDVVPISSNHFIVVGAYGLAFETFDFGKTWKPLVFDLGNDEQLHIYAAKKRGERIVLVGEFGLVIQSLDDGETWNKLNVPYDGSFFTVELPSDSEILIAGLKGNVWRSNNLGGVWENLSIPINATITSSRLISSGRIMLANQSGIIFNYEDEKISIFDMENLPPINNFILTDESIVALSVQGIRLINVISK